MPAPSGYKHIQNHLNGIYLVDSDFPVDLAVNGIHYILWGAVVSLGIMVTFVLIYMVAFQWINVFWVVSSFIVTALGFFSMLLGMVYIFHSVLSKHIFLKAIVALWILGGYACFYLSTPWASDLMGEHGFFGNFYPEYIFLSLQKDGQLC